MNQRGVDVIASSVQKTNRWLKEIAAELRVENRHQAYAALRCVLHALRDCLPVDEAAKLSSQLPLLIRGVYFDGWKPRSKPLRLTKAAFYEYIWESLGRQQGIDPPLAVRAVLNVLGRHVSRGEVDGVRAILPREVRALWDAVEVEEEERALQVEQRAREKGPTPRSQWGVDRSAPAKPWRPSDRFSEGQPHEPL